MDWRFSSDTPRGPAITGVPRGQREPLCWPVAVLVLAVMLAGAGCGKHAVRASEKEFLADQIMAFDHDGQETAADEHVITNREGSAGGRGTAGGGCGCN